MNSDVTIGIMAHQRDCCAFACCARVILAVCVIAICSAAISLGQPPQPNETFDELYRRGQAANAGLKTLTARFTETTTSVLLTRPLVERGTLAVQRPDTVVLHYTVPETRTVWIDRNQLVVSWPARNIYQVSNIGRMQGRVQKYFVDSDANELRKSFDITVSDTEQRRGTDHVSLLPKRSQIREGLARLDLWIDQSSLLLAAMRMTFANGDTKLMTLDDVVPNAAIAPGTFARPQQTAR
jgi:outer membrane lipoprotein-sorting protein